MTPAEISRLRWNHVIGHEGRTWSAPPHCWVWKWKEIMRGIHTTRANVEADNKRWRPIMEAHRIRSGKAAHA
jgi:hypothetical protein